MLFSASSLDSNLSIGSQTSVSNLLPTVCEREVKVEYNGLDFRLIVDSKSGPPISLLLVATSLHEKAAWCSDISQVRSGRSSVSSYEFKY